MRQMTEEVWVSPGALACVVGLSPTASVSMVPWLGHTPRPALALALALVGLRRAGRGSHCSAVEKRGRAGQRDARLATLLTASLAPSSTPPLRPPPCAALCLLRPERKRKWKGKSPSVRPSVRRLRDIFPLGGAVVVCLHSPLSLLSCQTVPPTCLPATPLPFSLSLLSISAVSSGGFRAARLAPGTALPRPHSHSSGEGGSLRRPACLLP